MPVKHGPKGMRGRLARKHTHRQRAALADPVNDKSELSVKFHRVNAPFQSILTFDLHEIPEDYDDDDVESVGGRIGMWHGRVTSMPESPLSSWSRSDKTDARLILKRMVRNCGQGDVQLRESKDGFALRIFRWGSISEVAQALRAVEGKK